MLFLVYFAAVALATIPEDASLDTCLSLCGSGTTDSETVTLCTLDCLILPQSVIEKWHSFPLLNISTELRECAQDCFAEGVTDENKFSCMSDCWSSSVETTIETRRRMSGGRIGGYHGYGGYGGYYQPYRPYVRPYYRPYVQPYYGSTYQPYYNYGQYRPVATPYIRRGPLQTEGVEGEEEYFVNVSSICLKYCDTDLPSMIADELNLTAEERANVSSFFDLEEQGLCLSSCVFSLLEDPNANYTAEEYEPHTVQCLSGCMTVQEEVVEERMTEFFENNPTDANMDEIDLEDIDVEICFMQCLDSSKNESSMTWEKNESSGRRRMSGGIHGRGGWYGGASGYYRPYYSGYHGYRPYYSGYHGYRPYYSGYHGYRPYYSGYHGYRPYYSGYSGYRPYYSGYRGIGSRWN